MKARLGTVLSNNVQMSRGLPPGALESPRHFHKDHGAGSERFDQELESSETDMELGRFCVGCDLLCGRCGAGCYIGAAAK